jgi:CIC family chloride channel protein
MGAAGVIVAPVYALLTRVNLVGGEQYSLHILYTLPVIQLIIIFCVMFVTTALVAGTGNSGGLFMPVMVMGAIVGIFAASVMGVPPVLLVIVGISAALCTTLNVPLASAVICIELWGPTAIIPSIVGSLVGYFVGKDYIIYHEIQWEELKE